MTPEDEAFDEIARKQGHSGGGFQAKRAAAADKLWEPRQWIWLSDADIRETIDSICQYSGDYDEFLCKKIERKIKELNT